MGIAIKDNNKLTAAFNWAALAAVISCALCVVVMLVLSLPGFTVARDRAHADAVTAAVGL